MKVFARSLMSVHGTVGVLAVAAFVFILAAPVQSQEWQYTTIAPAGARASTAYGINASGDIVGTFVDQGFVQHGFLLSPNGEYTIIDFPGAAGTDARGIGPNGEIVGIYWMNGDPMVSARGYQRTNWGYFYNVKYPGHSWEIPQRILPDGTIVGCRHDNDMMSSMRGVTIGRGRTSEIEAFASMNNGATPDGGLIVGLWTDMMTNQQQGYTIENGVFTPFMVPGSNLTSAWDVNRDRVIVGVFRVGTTVRGYSKRGDHYTTIHYPGSTVTRAFGINERGDIVGNYVTGGVTYAFVARVAAPSICVRGCLN